MNWQGFLEKLLKDFRISEYQLSSITGITQPTIYRIRSGKTLVPTQNTIKLLEQGLGIKIDDSNPENITYYKIVPKKEYEEGGIKIYEYPIIAKVYAGNSPEMFVSENIIEYIPLPYLKKENCFAVRVIGDSMNHIIDEGDIVLIDMDKEILNNDIVIARLKDGRQIVKRFKKLENNYIMLYSTNELYEPIICKADDIEAIYKVVGVWKNF